MLDGCYKFNSFISIKFWLKFYIQKIPWTWNRFHNFMILSAKQFTNQNWCIIRTIIYLNSIQPWLNLNKFKSYLNKTSSQIQSGTRSPNLSNIYYLKWHHTNTLTPCIVHNYPCTPWNPLTSAYARGGSNTKIRVDL